MEDLQEEAICARIQQARKEAGLNQDEFADLLEVIKRTVQNYESNRVPWSKMGQIADITGRSTRWLLHGEDTPDHVETDLTELKQGVAELAEKLDDLLMFATRRAVGEAVEQDELPAGEGAGDASESEVEP